MLSRKKADPAMTSDENAPETEVPAPLPSRPDLETALVVARERSTKVHQAVRAQAMRIQYKQKLCHSGLSSFLVDLGLPAVVVRGKDYDGKLVTRSPYDDIDPSFLTEAGLEAAVQLVEAETTEWLKKVRKRAIVEIANVGDDDVAAAFKVVGIDPLRAMTKVTVELRVSYNSSRDDVNLDEVRAAVRAAHPEFVLAFSGQDESTVENIYANTTRIRV